MPSTGLLYTQAKGNSTLDFLVVAVHKRDSENPMHEQVYAVTCNPPFTTDTDSTLLAVRKSYSSSIK